MSSYTDEAAAMKEMAENYERYFVPAIGGPLAADLVDAAALRPGERVLDVACGTGAVTRLAVQRVGADGAVAGLDPNPAMLGVARTTVGDAPVEWHQSTAEDVPLADDGFDVALCGMGMQFFADRRAALSEVRRVLKPGGRFVASLPGPTPPALVAMAEELADHVSPGAAGFVHMVFSLHDDDEIRAAADGAGFPEVSVTSEAKTLRLPPPAEFLRQYLVSTPLAIAAAGLDDEGRAALERDYAERCAPFVEDGNLVGQVEMTTLTARA